MRGKEGHLQFFFQPFRITPAYAGKSTGVYWCWRNRKDHPRLCGEKPPLFVKGHLQFGSPPPMRGKDYKIIVYKRWAKDHPRLCGEKLFQLFCGLFCHGSPPPMRGKVWSKTRCVDDIYGSPPPMRGKDLLVVQPCTADGITPAYAGKRDNLPPIFFIMWDHPRLCGEKGFYKKVPSVGIGSPPPMRGKASKVGGYGFSIRITPAYAGKSMGHNQRCLGYRDHPRLCGEKVKWLFR